MAKPSAIGIEKISITFCNQLCHSMYAIPVNLFSPHIYCKERNFFVLCNDETHYEIRKFDEELERTVYLIVYERQ